MKLFNRQKLTFGQMILSLILITVLLTSCINTSTFSPSSSAGSTGSTIENSNPLGNGVLNLEGSDPVTLDPATAVGSISSSYVVQIFSGLVSFDENMKIIPDIASSWDESADGTTYTFHLNQNVKFHDGKPVVASDFKYSWERALNPETGSITASIYLNDIVGSSDILSGKTNLLSGVTVIDDFTLQVTIDGPKAYFLYKMAFPTTFVVDRANVTSGSGWWRKPNGTGPFELESWETDQSLTLVRNDDYYGQKALLSQVNYKLYGGIQMQLYQQGSIDIASVSSDYLGFVTDPNNPISDELHIFPEMSIYFLGFNTSVPPFDDVNVRLAFSYAIDKEKVLTLSTEDSVTSAYGVLPPGMPGYNADLQGIRYDPLKAKELIAASKYGSVDNLPPIVWTTSGYGNLIGGLMGGIIEEWRRNLGVEVTVRQIEPDNYTYYIQSEVDEIYDLGWLADYPDPQDFLDILLHTGVQYNIGKYSNAQLDALLDKAAVEQDTNLRLQMYQQAEHIVIRDAPIVPLFFGRNYVLIKPYVKNLSFSPLGFPQLVKVSIQN